MNTLFTFQFPLFRRAFINLRGFVLVTPWLLHLVCTDLLLSLLLPASFVAPTTVYHLSSRLAHLVWRGVQFIFTSVNGAKITTSGDKLPEKESAIVVCNHVSWADFYLIQHLAIKSSMLGYCRYFAKQQLKWIPLLGWGLWAMRMPLISRRWDKDQKELDRVFEGPKVEKWPIWLVSYSEATRYTAQKYQETVRWCEAHDRPIPLYTLYPRTKGFVATIKALGNSSSVRAIYDLTVAHAHKGRFLEAPEMWQTLSQPDLATDWRFHVHAERFDIEDLAGRSDEELASWLEGRWMVKSALLQDLKRRLEDGQDWSEDAIDRQGKEDSTKKWISGYQPLKQG